MLNTQAKIIDIELDAEDLHNLGYQSKRRTPYSTRFRLQRDGSWLSYESGPDEGLVIQRPLVIGTLGGRHTGMTADLYLAERVVPGQSAFDTIYDRMLEICRFAPSIEIHLIYSGLTECTLGAVFALLAGRMTFKILRFDQRIRGYIPIDLSAFWKDIAE